MSKQIDSTNTCVVPSQIWPNLSIDLRMKVIWLLSQLAFNVVTSQPEQIREEVSDVTIQSK